jgi:galactokinase
MKTVSEVSVEAPGRICLFGDHQDYLGLPIIACAINRFVKLSAISNEFEIFNLIMPDINSSRSFSIYESFENLIPGDHFASAIRVAKRYGCIPNKGYSITITGKIPINAGLSSSSAIVVAWVSFLLKAFGCSFVITDELIAEIAYRSEVIEHDAPGGKMDQYSIALGGIIFLQTNHTNSITKIDSFLNGLIVGESGLSKNTLGLLGDLKEKALASIRTVQEFDSDFKLHSAVLEDVNKYSHVISEELKPFFYASIKNHMITQEAFYALNEEILNYDRIGALMNQHHSVLKNILKITTPKIDNMIDAALEAGAYGAKIVGSGGGGSICAITSNENKQRVIHSILKAGAKDAYPVLVAS